MVLKVRGYIFEYEESKSVMYHVVFPGRFMFGLRIDENDSIFFEGSNEPNLLEELVMTHINYRNLPKTQNESRYNVPIEVIKKIEDAVSNKNLFNILNMLGKLEKYEIEE